MEVFINDIWLSKIHELYPFWLFNYLEIFVFLVSFFLPLLQDFHNIRSCQVNCLKSKARVIKCNLESQNECKWYSPSSLSDLFALIKNLGEMKKSFRLVAGNTSVGIFKDYGPYHAYVGLKHVKEFREKKVYFIT